MARIGKVELTQNGGVATLSILDEKKINTIDTPTVETLLAMGESLRATSDLQLVILKGEGEKSFLGGVDINEMSGFTPEKARTFITKLHHLCRMFRTLPVPSIASIDGYCLGGGMEVAACCDLRIASDRSTFGMPEVKLGMPSVIEAAVFPSLIGWGRTRELLYTGRMVDAEEALHMGFVQQVAPPTLMDTAIQPWVDDILAAEPSAIRTQKRLIEHWLDNGLASGIEESIDAFAATFHSDVPTKRLQEFLDNKKRR